MSLITKEELIKASGLGKTGFMKKPIAALLMRFMKINAVNKLYDKIKNDYGINFFDSFVREQEINYVVFEEDLAKIPKTGAFIVVSNHPLGALDGILMCKILLQIRPDFKVMGNFLLTKIKPMEPFVISVNPFEKRKDAFNSASGMRGALKHLQEGGCLGIFPAGEVSNKNNESGEILDKKWETTALKLIRSSKVPVVPMYFHAANSNLFYNLAKFHPDLQTIMLPSEMMKKRDTPIRIRIGKPITAKQMNNEETIEELGEYLRKKVYMLKSYYDRRKNLTDKLKLPDMSLKFPLVKQENIVQNIIDETPIEDILPEIEKLKLSENKKLFSYGEYDVFFSKSDEIPFILREIGRQRELTFRSIGEGTNLPFDLDEYDNHYHHMFLWDNKERKIVGAYRMALGNQVMKKFGIEGFYISSLFEFDPELQPFFRKVIEMGRAYITVEYQQRPFPLFLLWRGIVHVCLRNPENKFLMGGVSISNKFSEFSKSLMIEFMRSHYYDSAVAQYVHPKNEYKVIMKESDKALFFEDMADADLNKLDKIIDDLEPELRLPVLIKKYIKQNAKVIAFNVDPNFNDAIDGLMYIRISDLPEDTIKPVLEELSDFLKRESEKKSTENQ